MQRLIEKTLLEWKESKSRLPLLMRGARQVGKTYVVEKFGKEAFSSFVSVNFEAEPQAIACFDSLDPEEILMKLQTVTGQEIRPGKTLLFLDEIQSCPKAILALRYFKEKLPALHIIGAGSLLEFALINGKFSFPVGRVQFCYLKPLSFYEYALARGREQHLEVLNHCLPHSPPTKKLHEEMLKLVREYFIIGGMPAAVSHFCQTVSLNEVSRIHEILLSTYKADFSKYASETLQNYLKPLFQGIFPLIAKHFKYSKIDPHVRSREIKNALDHLQWAGLFYSVFAASATSIPLSAQIKSTQFKMLFLDTGLCGHALEIDPKLLFDKKIEIFNRGAICEQFVGQELLANSDPLKEKQLFFWQREKRSSSAEVDYLYTHESQIYPIEVKAGESGRLRSIKIFMQEKKCPLGIQVSEKPLGKNDNLLSIPFYLLWKIADFL
ncbi:MAG: ATP-binding protein [Chlamydiales bacterium]